MHTLETSPENLTNLSLL